MSGQDSFGELRSLLQREPSLNAWQLTCALLENWSGSDLEEIGLPYAVAHTARWPAELCRIPKLWLERALKGQREPRLAVVRAITGHFGIDPKSARLLAEATAGCAIEELRITISGIGDADLAPLLDALWWPHLRVLSLRSTHVSAHTLEAMFSRDVVPPLHALDLSQLKDNRPYAWHLLAKHAALLPELRIFAARATHMGDEGLISMAQAGLFERAEALYLTSCRIGEAGLSALAKHASQLTTLVLDKNPLPASARALLNDPNNLPNLRALNIDGTSLRSSHLERSFEAPRWTGF